MLCEAGLVHLLDGAAEGPMVTGGPSSLTRLTFQSLLTLLISDASLWALKPRLGVWDANGGAGMAQRKRWQSLAEPGAER